MTYVPSDHEHAPKLAATPARQGRWGRHVFWVLVASMLLATIALFSAWAWRSGDLAGIDTARSPAAVEARANAAKDAQLARTPSAPPQR